jgi:hypothetical protein
MSVTSIPVPVRLRLWGISAGRCEYDGCNERLWIDAVTKTQLNTSYIAHIIADTPEGPRGDPELSSKLKADVSNLMLLCDKHHRLIDIEDESGHPVDRLREMKQAHEKRIDILTDIDEGKQSHVLLYGANIGSQGAQVSFSAAKLAMIPDRYPAEPTPLSLGLKNSSFKDRDDAFWRIEPPHLQEMFDITVKPLLRNHAISHLSVFAFAPQPLLILLGSLLTDITPADVYQLHREPPGWAWQEEPKDFAYSLEEPTTASGDPALILAFSATVTDDRVRSALQQNDISVWRISPPLPGNDFLKSRIQAQRFREIARKAMDKIKARHGERATINVFPVMPVALAVEFGRILMPKADLPLRIFDENKMLGGFFPTITINGR